jgi:transcription antitermination factor NusG
MTEMDNDKQTLSKWSAEGMDWFALACKTYEERRVAHGLQTLCDTESTGRYFVFVPTRDRAHSKEPSGMRRVPWLNGYVFIATTERAEHCTKMVDMLMVSDTAIFKLLSYDGSKASPLTEEDKLLFVAILDEDFHIPALKADVVDGRVKVADNPIEANGGKITKVDKRKRSAEVEMDIMHEVMKYEVALEFPQAEDVQRLKNTINKAEETK